MNFLAHYLIAQPTTDDDFLIGALLPDMARQAGIQITGSKMKDVHGQLFSGMKSGMELHWMADKKFHQSSLFNLGVALWKVHLEKRFPGVERKFFLFHLFFEMWLDRILLAREPSQGLEMYDNLALADVETLTHFSTQHLGDVNQQVVKTYKGFVNRKFILDYQNEVLFARIGTEVFSYVTQQVWNENWQNPVMEALIELQKFELDVLYIWDEFVLELKKEWEDRKG